MRTAESLRDELQQFVREFKTAEYSNRGMKGAIIGLLNKAARGDENRHKILGYLFGKETTKELTGAEWIALARWTELREVGGYWLPQADFFKEVELLINATKPYEIFD